MITFIAADCGYIELYENIGDDAPVAIADNVKTLAFYLVKHGVAHTVATSSSIDFADEYGFAHHDDAKKLWERAIKLYIKVAKMLGIYVSPNLQ